MKTRIVAFTEDHIPEAGRLLALRHQNDRRKQPLLPERFLDSAVATGAVNALWQEKFRNGYAAFRDGKMVAYLIGEYALQPWGRCGSVYLPGYALVEGESRTIIQDLYAMLGEDWVKKGVFIHGLYISATDPSLIEAFFDLGFGKERVDALLDLRTLVIPKRPEADGITVRRAGNGDNHHLAGLSGVIFRALSDPPYWHPTVPEVWDELKEGWAELADDKEWTVWMALEKTEALGTVGFRPEAEAATQMLAPGHTIYLSVAATQPQARGRGVSTMLTWRGLDQARQDGYEICYTNWISSNLLASRHWPRYGFQDVAYRLAKKVDPLIAWTKDAVS
jgi:GNAT superfamily N-acetyltransferase